MKTEEYIKQNERSMGLTEEYTGACRYCGQLKTGQLPMGLNWTPEEVDEYVTETCDCFEAMFYTKKKKQKEAALRQIEVLFGESSDQKQEAEILNLLREGAIAMAEGQIQKLNIDIDAKTKAKMSITSKGKIKIERQNTERDSCEA